MDTVGHDRPLENNGPCASVQDHGDYMISWTRPGVRGKGGTAGYIVRTVFVTTNPRYTRVGDDIRAARTPK